MSSLPGIPSLIATGTKLWLDSIDPALVPLALEQGVTGATSNPIIIADLIKTGRFDDLIGHGIHQGLDDETIAWQLTDELVSRAEQAFRPIFDDSRGNNGYVSFELDPLLEDLNDPRSVTERAAIYVRDGQRWSAGHPNRMIKIPATPAGLAALPDLAAAGVPLNVTLIFSARQYQAARDAIVAGVERRGTWAGFKSVYSIFVSRIDVYTQQHAPQLSKDSQGWVGIFNAQRIWKMNREFWQSRQPPLEQEMVFASTGTKNPHDAPWKYVQALAGGDIQTNPPATNAAVALSPVIFQPTLQQWPNSDVVQDIQTHVNFEHLEQTLMREGLEKFATPQKQLLQLIAAKRQEL